MCEQAGGDAELVLEFDGREFAQGEQVDDPQAHGVGQCREPRDPARQIQLLSAHYLNDD